MVITNRSPNSTKYLDPRVKKSYRSYLGANSEIVGILAGLPIKLFKLEIVDHYPSKIFYNIEKNVIFADFGVVRKQYFLPSPLRRRNISFAAAEKFNTSKDRQ